MGMNWDNVEMIRNAQASAKKRFDATQLATQEEIQKVLNSETAKQLTLPRISEIEQMLFRLRSELIDYIVAHGLVDGMIWNGVLQPVQNGKIVITSEMIDMIVEFLGYFRQEDVQAFLEEYLPANFYVKDENYVHTDNNFDNDYKEKLDGIESGAEVNKIINVIFNGVKVLDDGTRTATITITPQDIKNWYESNPNTNAFTDVEKTKLAGIEDGADVNKVEDVIVNRRSVMNENKQAIISAEIIQDAYESNENVVRFDPDKDFKLKIAYADSQTNKEDIANLSHDLNDTKDSVSELGDEVNSIAGRVTNLEKKPLISLEGIESQFSSLLTEDMLGSGLFAVHGNMSCKISGEAKETEIILVGIGKVEESGSGFTMNNAMFNCLRGTIRDEIGTAVQIVTDGTVSGFRYGTSTHNIAGVSLWQRNDVREIVLTFDSVQKMSGYGDSADVDAIKKTKLSYSVVNTTFADGVSIPKNQGGYVRAFGKLTYKVDGVEKTQNIGLCGVGSHFDNTGGDGTNIELRSGQANVKHNGVPILGDFSLLIGGSSSGASVYLWQVFTCFHTDNVTDLSFQITRYSIVKEIPSESGGGSSQQVWSYHDKPLSWLKTGTYEPIKEGDTVIIGYDMKYGDEDTLHIGRSASVFAEFKNVSMKFVCSGLSQYTVVSEIPVVSNLPKKIDTDIIYGIALTESTISLSGKIDFDLSSNGILELRYISTSSSGTQTPRALLGSVVSSMDRWSLTIIRG